MAKNKSYICYFNLFFKNAMNMYDVKQVAKIDV
jgi:hypothetical protein